MALIGGDEVAVLEEPQKALLRNDVPGMKARVFSVPSPGLRTPERVGLYEGMLDARRLVTGLDDRARERSRSASPGVAR